MFRLKVREIAQKKGISQYRIVRRSEVDPTTVRRIFCNDRTNITLETLARLAKALEVDVSELIESSENLASSD